jgi:hypothetical protein
MASGGQSVGKLRVTAAAPTKVHVFAWLARLHATSPDEPGPDEPGPDEPGDGKTKAA